MNSLHTLSDGVFPLLAMLRLRAEMLAPVIALSYLCGEFFARGPFEACLRGGDAAVARLAKLDKKKRGVAKLVYRGMIAVFMLIIPAMFLAALLSQDIPALKAATYMLLFLWFGHCLAPWRTFGLLRRAKANDLPLELPGLDYLFADSHAVLRHLVAERLRGFMVGVVGGSFWYLLGGLPLMAAYLALAAAADTYRSDAFGWAARSLFVLMDLAPRLIGRILLTLASLFTAQTKPFAGLFVAEARTSIADMLDIALGGPTPKGELPWVGKGTARLTPKHLQRALTLVLAATTLLILLLASAELVKTLNMLK